MGTVRISLRSMGVLKKVVAKGTTSEAVNATMGFRLVLQQALAPVPFSMDQEVARNWRPRVTPTLSGAEMLMTRPPALDQEQFETAVTTAIERFRSMSPAPLFVA